MTQIAENLEDIYGVGFTGGQAEGYSRGYNTGMLEGGIAGRLPCLTNHYITSFFGSGTKELIQEIPFEPDIVTVYTTHSYTSQMPNCYRGFTVDMRACGRHMGNVFYVLGEGITKSSWLVSNLDKENVAYPDGKFHFHLVSESVKDVVWVPHIRYNMVAVKFPDENPRDLLVEQIEALPDAVPQGCTGQLSYTESVVYTYFTPEEWAALTAKKPNWTFVLK